jgi:hypothetical protein
MSPKLVEVERGERRIHGWVGFPSPPSALPLVIRKRSLGFSLLAYLLQPKNKVDT